MTGQRAGRFRATQQGMRAPSRSSRSLLGLAACSWACWGCSSPAAGAPRAESAALTIGGAAIDVAIEDGRLDVSRAELMAWISTAAGAVTAYFGRFPVARYRIVIEPVAGRSGVLSGTTWAGRRRALADPPRRAHHRRPARARLGHDPRDGAHRVSGSGPRAPLDRGGDRHVRRAARAIVDRALSRRPGCGPIWSTDCPMDCRGRAIADSITPIPGAGPTGAVRCSACSPIWRSAIGPAAAAAWSTRCAGSWRPVATIRSTGRSSARSVAGDRAVGVPVLEELYGRMKDAPVPTDLDALWHGLGSRSARARCSSMTARRGRRCAARSAPAPRRPHHDETRLSFGGAAR